MRGLVLGVAVLALAGCEADGRPSKLLGSALGGFAKGYSNGSATVQQAQGQAAKPMQAAPQAQPPAAQAFFTGRGAQVQTVTGGLAWQCDYHYAGTDFVLLFDSFCPAFASVR